MAGTSGIVSRGSVMLRNLKAVLFVFTILFAFVPGILGQTTTATLSGTVLDKDSLSVPGAQVVVTNKANKFTRTSTANGAGVFSFPGLQSGDYTLTVTAKGFETFIVSSIHLNPGDTNNVDSIRMKVGNVDVSVTVDAGTLNNVQDTGERSSLITSKDLDKLSLEGREVTELLKILPGSAIVSPGNQSASSNQAFDPSQTGFGGATGSYSMSGSPVNGAAIRSDGANLTDPTSGAAGLQTVNAESTAEVKVQTANFGADSANGPPGHQRCRKVGKLRLSWKPLHLRKNESAKLSGFSGQRAGNTEATRSVSLSRCKPGRTDQNPWYELEPQQEIGVLRKRRRLRSAQRVCV